MGDCKDCPPQEKQQADEAAGKVVGWRIWYTDGTVRDSKGDTAVPRDGVLAVVIYYEKPNTKRIMTGSDYYFYSPGKFGPVYGQCSPGDSKEEIEARYPGAVVLRGKWTDDITMHKLDKILIDSKWE